MSKIIKLNKVRLSFPSLFEFEKFEGDPTGKYSATFLLDKKFHAAAIKELRAEIQLVGNEAFNNKIPSTTKLCLQDGDEREDVTYHGHMSLKASTKRRPQLLNKQLTPVLAEDDIFYAGCYVNALIDIWASAKYKTISASLIGVQFAADGERLGSAVPDAKAYFTEEEDDI